MTTRIYTCVTNISINSVDYAPGDLIVLDPATASTLLAALSIADNVSNQNQTVVAPPPTLSYLAQLIPTALVLNSTNANYVSVNASKKQFTVPSEPNNNHWALEALFVDYTSSSVGSTRSLTVDILDNTGALFLSTPLATQAVSTEIKQGFVTGSTDLFSTKSLIDTFGANTKVSPTLPFAILPAGYIIQIYDANSQDISGDILAVQLLVSQSSFYG